MFVYRKVLIMNGLWKYGKMSIFSTKYQLAWKNARILGGKFRIYVTILLAEGIYLVWIIKKVRQCIFLYSAMETFCCIYVVLSKKIIIFATESLTIVVNNTKQRKERDITEEFSQWSSGVHVFFLPLFIITSNHLKVFITWNKFI